MYTTLNKIREHNPCKDGWETLLKHLGKTKPDDEPLPLLTILDSNGLDDTLWCFRAVDGFEKEKLLLSVTYARDVEHLMPAESKKAFDVFERYANGLATQEEFEDTRAAAAATRAAAYAAARAADACAAADADASWAVAHAASAAHAAWSAAAAPWSAAADAAAHAAAATDDNDYAARAAGAAANAYLTIKAKQETQLRQLLERTCTQH